jgi:TolB protein
LLRHGPWPQWDPSISAGGRLIAFRGYYGGGDGDYALYVGGTNGCGVRRLTHGIAGNPTWSPDLSWIAFDTSGAGSIWKVRRDGHGLTRIAALTRTHYQDQPVWSPDGSRIAFVRYVHNRGQIWLMRPDGSGAMLLHSDRGASDEDPAWSHDGNSLAFVEHVGQLAGPAEHTWIETINASGSNLRRVTNGQADAWNPVWLPRDTGIAFLSGYTDSPGDLYVARPDGKDVRKIASLDTPQFTWTDAALPRQAC